MEFSIDTKKIKKLSVDKGDGVTINYEFSDGLITAVTLIDDAVKAPEECGKVLSDTEMIDKVKNSEFMDELVKARKKYKLSKEIDESFPNEDDFGHPKNPTKKTSDESLGMIKEIIKKDLDGTLDEIARRKLNNGAILLNYDYSDDDGKQYELDKCKLTIHTIEDKLLSIIRSSDGTMNEDVKKKFDEVLDDYKTYCDKRKELSDEIWKNMTETSQKKS